MLSYSQLCWLWDQYYEEEIKERLYWEEWKGNRIAEEIWN